MERGNFIKSYIYVMQNILLAYSDILNRNSEIIGIGNETSMEYYEIKKKG
jgi:hypothetical protein